MNTKKKRPTKSTERILSKDLNRVDPDFLAVMLVLIAAGAGANVFAVDKLLENWHLLTPSTAATLEQSPELIVFSGYTVLYIVSLYYVISNSLVFYRLLGTYAEQKADPGYKFVHKSLGYFIGTLLLVALWVGLFNLFDIFI